MHKSDNIMIPSRYWFICSIILFILLVFFGQSFAATYYVSKTGSDNNTCDSIGVSACATINEAINRANSGDTIEIQPGTYNMDNETGDHVNVNKANLTITAYDQANKPILDGKDNEDMYGIIDINATGSTISYLKVHRGTVRRPYTSWRAGSIKINAINTTIDNVDTYYDYHGINIAVGKLVTITNVKTYGNGYHNGGCADGNGHGIVHTVSGTGTSWSDKILIKNVESYDNGGDGFQSGHSQLASYIEFNNSIFRNNGEDGINLKKNNHIRIINTLIHSNDENGIVTDPVKGADNVEIYGSKIYDNGFSGIWIEGGCDNWDIYNNLIYGNAKNTKDCWNTFGVKVGDPDTEIYHNTFYDNGTTAGTRNHAAVHGSAIMKNNVFYNNNGTWGNISSSSGGTIDNNYVYPPSPGLTGSNAITSSNPMFVNASAGNFYLLSNSLLIDAGINAGITTDFQNNLRPAGGGFDVGAYEFGGASGDYVAPDPPTNFQVVLN